MLFKPATQAMSDAPSPTDDTTCDAEKTISDDDEPDSQHRLPELICYFDDTFQVTVPFPELINHSVDSCCKYVDR